MTTAERQCISARGRAVGDTQLQDVDCVEAESPRARDAVRQLLEQAEGRLLESATAMCARLEGRLARLAGTLEAVTGFRSPNGSPVVVDERLAACFQSLERSLLHRLDEMQCSDEQERRRLQQEIVDTHKDVEKWSARIDKIGEDNLRLSQELMKLCRLCRPKWHGDCVERSAAQSKDQLAEEMTQRAAALLVINKGRLLLMSAFRGWAGLAKERWTKLQHERSITLLLARHQTRLATATTFAAWARACMEGGREHSMVQSKEEMSRTWLGHDGQLSVLLAIIERRLVLSRTLAAWACSDGCLERREARTSTGLLRRIRDIESRGRISIDLKTGEVMVLVGMEFLPRKRTDLPTAEFLDAEAGASAVRDVAELQALFQVHMVIEGHTKGDWEQLAVNRADFIVEQLERMGIQRAHMDARGFPGKRGLNRACVIVRLAIYFGNCPDRPEELPSSSAPVPFEEPPGSGGQGLGKQAPQPEAQRGRPARQGPLAKAKAAPQTVRRRPGA